MEIWKPVKDYETKYLVSSEGRVKSLLYNKIMKPHYGSCGYINAFLYDGKNKKKTKKVHRLVAEAFIENPKNYPQVNHKDGNKKNNNVDNLEWVNNSMNLKHAYSNKLKSNFGTKNPYHKLSDNDVKTIAKYFDMCYNRQEIAEKYKINITTVYTIGRRERKLTNGEQY